MLTTRLIEQNEDDQMIHTVKDSTFTNLIDGKQVPMDATVRYKRSGMKTSNNAKSNALLQRQKMAAELHSTGLSKIDTSVLGSIERKGTTTKRS